MTTAIAMQTRCINCLREVYGPAILAFSEGKVACVCGYVAVPQTFEQWMEALRLARLAQSDDE